MQNKIEIASESEQYAEEDVLLQKRLFIDWQEGKYCYHGGLVSMSGRYIDWHPKWGFFYQITEPNCYGNRYALKINLT